MHYEDTAATEAIIGHACKNIVTVVYQIVNGQPAFVDWGHRLIDGAFSPNGCDYCACALIRRPIQIPICRSFLDTSTAIRHGGVREAVL